MTHTRLWVAATIIAGIILIGFVITVPRAGDVSEPRTTTEDEIVPPEVRLRDSFKKGMHTITGTVEAPNPCTVISATAIYEDATSSDPSIRVVLSMPKDTGICVQQAVTLTFSTTVEAPANVPISATVNDGEATVTLL